MADGEYRRGIYQVRDSEGNMMYIGSTTCSLETLESNHRNYVEKQYSPTEFRMALARRGSDWTFSWAIEPTKVSKQFIEIQEQALIQFLKPQYNIDMAPYWSSIRHGRYKENTL